MDHHRRDERKQFSTTSAAPENDPTIGMDERELTRWISKELTNILRYDAPSEQGLVEKDKTDPPYSASAERLAAATRQPIKHVIAAAEQSTNSKGEPRFSFFPIRLGLGARNKAC